MSATVTSPEVLAKATEWLVTHVAKDRIATAIVAEVEQIEVTQGLYRSHIPGQTTWWVEYRAVNRIGKPTIASGRVEVPGDMVEEWVQPTPTTFNCMWCSQEFQAENERDYHEEGCG